MQKVGQRHRAMPFEGLGESSQRARRRDRLIADFVEVFLQDEAEAILRFGDDLVCPHVLGGCQRRAAVKVDERVLSGGWQIELHGTKSSDSAHEGIDHGLDQGARDRRVNCVAARLQGQYAGLHGFRLRC